MKRKKSKKRPNWDLIRDRMMEYVVDALTERWNIPIILDVFEYKQIPLAKVKIDGCVGCIFDSDGEVYIDHIAIRKQSKENSVYTLAHECGHIMDFLNLNPEELIEYSKIHGITGVLGRSKQPTAREKRILFEGEKRAYSEGLELLKQAGLIDEYYLYRYLESRQKEIFLIMAILFHKRKGKEVATLTGGYKEVDSVRQQKNNFVRVYSFRSSVKFRKK